MKLSYKLRKFLCAMVLLIGLPVYIVAAAALVGEMDRPHIVLEVAIYLGLGLVWALPFRSLFRGIGRADPDLETSPEDQR